MVVYFDYGSGCEAVAYFPGGEYPTEEILAAFEAWAKDVGGALVESLDDGLEVFND